MRAVSLIRRLRHPRLVVGAIVAAVVVTSGGVAYAYWSASGTGSGTGTTASMATVTVDGLTGASPDSTLYPGGTADVVMKVSNPNGFPVQVVSITQTAGHEITTDDTHSGGCTTTGVMFTAPSSPNITIPANASGRVIHLSQAATMDKTSSSGCQGATFHIPVTLTVQR